VSRLLPVWVRLAVSVPARQEVCLLTAALKCSPCHYLLWCWCHPLMCISVPFCRHPALMLLFTGMLLALRMRPWCCTTPPLPCATLGSCPGECGMHPVYSLFA
jgi:hypothetical protein